MKEEVYDFFNRLFGTESWPARWNCGKWTDFHGWMYIISDLMIWSAYFAIPLAILYFILKRKQSIPFLNVFWLFGAFILLCGLTHLIDAVIFWIPIYRVSALLRLVTAVISWATVISLLKIIPLALSLKSAGELEWEIEERKKAETALGEAKVRAEEAVITKDYFMANMSHEIRTPINAIFGFTSLLGMTKLNEEQQEYIQAIKSSSDNLLTIINDILDFSKIEAGMLKIEQVPFQLHELLGSLRVMFQQRTKDKGINWEIKIGDAVPNALLGDPTRITQILNNLITNAIKFTDKGSITVHVSLVEQAGDHSVIEFKVEDTGIGIDKEKLGPIFERFTQAEASTSRKFGGTGLGLSIVKSLVDMQGGSIKADSILHQGSTFIVQLPFVLNTHEEPVAKKSFIIDALSSNILQGIKVLLVEDNELNQRLMQKVLGSFGINYTVVDDGLKAVNFLKEEQVDIILMDIQIPELDGYAATRYIRQELMLKTPIMAMTAHVLAGERERCFREGMNDYISKPFKMDELHEKLCRLLINSRSI